MTIPDFVIIVNKEDMDNNDLNSDLDDELPKCRNWERTAGDGQSCSKPSCPRRRISTPDLEEVDIQGSRPAMDGDHSSPNNDPPSVPQRRQSFVLDLDEIEAEHPEEKLEDPNAAIHQMFSARTLSTVCSTASAKDFQPHIPRRRRSLPRRANTLSPSRCAAAFAA